MYNIMSCSGFGTEVLGGCSMAWIGLVILFFVGAFLRKWGGEEFSIPFNFISCLVIGFLSYIVLVTFTGSPKWSLFAGLIGLLFGGYITPFFYEEFGSSE